MTHVKPLDPLADMIGDFVARGGTIWVCRACVKSRGCTQESLRNGVIISGASVMHERIKQGAATLSFRGRIRAHFGETPGLCHQAQASCREVALIPCAALKTEK